jgi:hypothetical protein
MVSEYAPRDHTHHTGPAVREPFAAKSVRCAGREPRPGDCPVRASGLGWGASPALAGALPATWRPLPDDGVVDIDLGLGDRVGEGVAELVVAERDGAVAVSGGCRARAPTNPYDLPLNEGQAQHVDTPAGDLVARMDPEDLRVPH